MTKTYRVSSRGDTSKVIDQEGRCIYKTESGEREKAKQVAKHLNSGGGFSDWTPQFMCCDGVTFQQS